MKPKVTKKQLPQFATFNAVYCSGVFINDGTLVTTMCLLFEKVWLLNHLELVIEFSKKFRLNVPEDLPWNTLVIEPITPNTDKDPFANLTLKQRQTAMQYLYIAQNFFMSHHQLIKEKVLCTDLYPSGEVLHAELIETGLPGGLNRYRVSQNHMTVVTEADTIETLNALISRGSVPLLSNQIGGLYSKEPQLRPKYLSSLLAMKSVELTLPQMKAVHPDIILEARERLKDLLPSFWSSMFKLSTDFKGHLEQGQSLRDIEQECEDYIDTTIRPALIELNSKLEKDRKSWFHKILSTFAQETKLIIGKPPLTVGGIVSSGLQLGANVALDIAQSESASYDAGLTYIIELNKLIQKND